MGDNMTADPARSDELVLVDGLDRVLGSATKERVHREGLLHRAFSVVLTRDTDHGVELLLARRAPGKYHSSGLWTNSCCSHPRAGEQLLDAVNRRIREELGCSTRELRELAAFVYRAEFADGLCEYEYDHVFVGALEGELALDTTEVDAVRWASIEDLSRELAETPEQFTAWAFTVFSLVLRELAH